MSLQPDRFSLPDRLSLSKIAPKLLGRPVRRSSQGRRRALSLERLEMRTLLSSTPSVTTGTVGSITSTGATINGTVNPNGTAATAEFQYSISPSFTGTAQTTISSGFNQPAAVAVDSAGDVFVGDIRTNVVSEIKPDGTVISIGSGFNHPYGLAVDGLGNVFVADSGNRAVKEVLPDGTIKTIVSGLPTASLSGVAVDGSGNVFFLLAGQTPNSGTVMEVLTNSTIKTIASGFAYPQGLAVDGSGNVFVADSGNNAVKEILPDSTIRTIGSGFFHPASVAVDGAGNVIVADTGNDAVKEILLDGTTLTLGSLGARSVAVDTAGDVFVADLSNSPDGRVVEMTTPTVTATPSALTGNTSTPVSGTLLGLTPGTTYYYREVAVNAAGKGVGAVQSFTTPAPPTVFSLGAGGSALTTSATISGTVNPNGTATTVKVQYSTSETFTPTVQTTIGSGFNSPVGLAVDAFGNVFVADYGNNQVKQLRPDGTMNTIGSGFGVTRGVAADAAGNVYSADLGGDGQLKEVLADGTVLTIGSGFNNPQGVAVDGAGNVYVADSGNGAVKEVLPDGTVLTLATGLIDPAGVAVDSAGNVYVADYSANTVYQIAPDGSLVAIGSGFNGPNSVAVDAAGDVFVADSGNNAVKEILPDGTTVTVATGLNFPLGVAVDAAGDVFVADSGNNRVVELSPPTVTATPSPLTGTTATTVSATLTGLTPGTKYYVQMVTFGGGGTVISSDNWFVTPTGPTVTSPTATHITAATATLGGTVTSEGDSAITKRGVLYAPSSAGLSLTLGTSGVIEIDVPGTTGTFTGAASGLSSQTAYTFEIFATNAAGTTYSTASTFTTPAAPPTVSTSAASSVTATNATLNGTVNPNGTPASVKFQYSTSPTFAPTIQTTLASGINQPVNLAVDAAGNVFVADWGDGIVKKILTDGTVQTLASGLNSPRGIAVDNAGNVYVANLGTDSDVIEIHSDGSIQTIGSGFNNPQGVAVDGAGNVYVADSGNGAVKEVLPDGTILTLATGLNDPADVAVDSAGHVYVADYYVNTVYEIAPDSSLVAIGSGFNGPNALAVDAAGDVFVADSGNNAVKEILPDGTTVTVATGLNIPLGVAVDAVGDIFVSNTGDGRIIELSPPTVTATPSPLTGTTATTVSATLTGLTPGTTYYYRVVASNAVSMVADTQSTPQSLLTQSTLSLNTAILNASTNQPISGNPPVGLSVVDSASLGFLGPIPTGTITFNFYNIANPVYGSTTPVSTETVQLSNGNVPNSSPTMPLALGGYAFIAVYSGDSTYTMAVSPVEPFTVGQGTTTTTVTAGNAPSVYGQNVTFTATVAVDAPGSGTPTGSVEFWNGTPTTGIDLGAGTPNGHGAWTLTYPGALAAGTYSINAVYSGDANFTTSASPFSLTVNPAVLTVTADNQSKDYDGSPFSSFTYQITGYVNGENAATANVVGSPAFGGPASTATDAGTYAIVPSAGTLSAPNYVFGNFNNGMLTIVPDIQMTGATADGSTTLTLSYTLLGTVPSPFQIGLYSSGGTVFDANASLLATLTISDPADLMSGTHTKSYTIGGGSGELALPGAGLPAINGDENILAVANPSNLVNEWTNADNTSVFSGVYHAPGSAVMVQGTEDADVVSVAGGSSLQITLNGSTYTYNPSDVSEVQIRTDGGDDLITLGAGIATPASLWGGDGDDTFRFADGASITGGIDGGGGTNTIDDSAFTSAPTAIPSSGTITGVGTTFSNIQTLIGSATSGGILKGSASAATTFRINSANAGTIGATNFSNFSTLIGGAGDDTFTFGSGAGISGSIDGGGGANTIDQSAYTWNINANLITNTISGVAGTFANIATLIAGTGANALTGPAAASTFNINGVNAGSISGVVTFANYGSLIGGPANDTFKFTTGASITGTLYGGSGANTIDDSALTGNINVNLAASTINGVGTIFSKVAAIIGGTGSNTLTGPAAASTFTITAANAGTVAGIAFSKFANLAGGAGNDVFKFNKGTAFAGSIDGGGGTNTIDQSAYTSNINANLTTNTISGIAGTFANIATLIAGTGANALTGPAAASTFNINGVNAGSISGVVAFANYGSLIGGPANDTFKFTTGASITGTLYGGSGANTIDDSALTGNINVNLAASAINGVGTSFSKVAAIIGGTGSNTLTGPAAASTFTITAPNAGSVGGIAFGKFANLAGGAGNDVFKFNRGTTIAGSIDGGGGANTIDQSAYTSNINANLTTNTISGIAGTFANIATLIAGTGANALTGPAANSTFAITSANTGSVGGFGFSNFGSLIGGVGNDVFQFSNGATVSGMIYGGSGANTIDDSAVTANVAANLATSTLTGVGTTFGKIQTLIGGAGTNTLTGPAAGSVFRINAADAGTVAGVAFSKFGSLAGGAGNDTFVFGTAGILSGTLDGGAGVDEIDDSALTTAVTINLGNGNATAVGSTVSNIENARGGSGNDTLIGSSSGGILIGGSGNDMINGGSGRSILIGGTGIDTVTGGSSDDIVIGGSTSFDGNIAALDSILAEWQSADSYAARVNLIKNGGGLNGSNKLILGSTIIDDIAANTLTGGSGTDWFFKGSKDNITDLQAGEQVN